MAEYIPSLIEAIGGIIASVLAAFIAAGYVSKAFNRNIAPLFLTYSDRKHDVGKILRKAKKNIYLVASIGDQLFVSQEQQIREHLKKTIKIFGKSEKLKLYVLIQGKSQYYELEKYINANHKLSDEEYAQLRVTTLEKFKKIQEDFPNQVEIREFHSFLSASYIGVDIDDGYPDTKVMPDAIIQVMLYQYGVTAQSCPITYFSFKENEALFRSTSNSICDMWEHGETI